MATKYDTWKTDVPCDPRSEWISEKTYDLVHERLQDHRRVKSAISDVILSDYDEELADNLARFLVKIDGAAGDRLEYFALTLRDFLLGRIEPAIGAEADTDAELEWENRQLGAPE
jgi:hypothetical protein